MKILVIPDIHLKTWIIRLATVIMRWLINENENLPEDERQKIGAVFLEDLADDFAKEDDTDSYAKVFDACIEFIKTYPTTYFCTPLERVLYEEENRLLSTDVFSTQPNGKPIGDLSEKQFVVIDTVTMEYERIPIPENILKDLYEDGGHLIDDWLGKKNGENKL